MGPCAGLFPHVLCLIKVRVLIQAFVRGGDFLCTSSDRRRIILPSKLGFELPPSTTSNIKEYLLWYPGKVDLQSFTSQYSMLPLTATTTSAVEYVEALTIVCPIKEKWPLPSPIRPCYRRYAPPPPPLKWWVHSSSVWAFLKAPISTTCRKQLCMLLPK